MSIQPNKQDFDAAPITLSLTTRCRDHPGVRVNLVHPVACRIAVDETLRMRNTRAENKRDRTERDDVSIDVIDSQFSLTCCGRRQVPADVFPKYAGDLAPTFDEALAASHAVKAAKGAAASQTPF
jgi:hypothetical protein